MHDILYSCLPCKEGIRLLASVYVLTDTTNLQGRIGFSFKPWNTISTSIPPGNIVDTNIPNRNIIGTCIPHRNIVDTSIPHRNIVGTGIPHRNIIDTRIPHRNIVGTGIPNRNIISTSTLRITTKFQLPRPSNCCFCFAIWKPLKGVRDFPRYLCVRCYVAGQ